MLKLTSAPRHSCAPSGNGNEMSTLTNKLHAEWLEQHLFEMYPRQVHRKFHLLFLSGLGARDFDEERKAVDALREQRARGRPVLLFRYRDDLRQYEPMEDQHEETRQTA